MLSHEFYIRFPTVPRFSACLTLAWIALLAGPPKASHANAEGDVWPQEDYLYSYRDTARDVIVGEIVSLTEVDRIPQIRLRALTDLRGTIAEGADVSIIYGALRNDGKIAFDWFEGRPGQIAVLFVKRGDRAGEYHLFPAHFYIFGVYAFKPFIAPKDAPLLAAALKEMRQNLDAPCDAGMTKSRARQLLQSKNVYLWSLACWRLVQDAEKDDIEMLKRFFEDPNLTFVQALFLDEALHSCTGSQARPSDLETLQLFRWFVQTHADEQLAAESRGPTTEPHK